MRLRSNYQILLFAYYLAHFSKTMRTVFNISKFPGGTLKSKHDRPIKITIFIRAIVLKKG